MIKHDAEASLLGCLITTPAEIDRLQDKLSQEGLWGYKPHELICRKLIQLRKDKTPIDAVILKEAFTSSELAEIGGPSYIATLVASVLESSSPDSYYKVVYDAFLRRSYSDLGERLIKASAENETVESIAEMAESVKTKHLEVKAPTISEATDEAIDRLLVERTNGVDLFYGVRPLNEIMGGIRRKKLTLIAGKTSHCKSTVARNVIALHNLVENKKCRVLYNGFENVEDIPMAMASARSGVPLTVFTKAYDAKESDFNRAGEALTQLREFKDRMVIMPGESMAKMRSVCRAFKPDIVILDYIQRYAEKHMTGDDKRNFVSRTASQMQDIALEFNCAAFVLSQIKRLENDRRHQAPEIGDLKESGDLENYADNIILLHWPWRDVLSDREFRPDDYRFIIGKNKLGPCLEIRARLNVDTLTIC